MGMIMKIIKYSLIFYFCFILRINVAPSQSYIPNSDSPIGKGEHPRLHITQETLPYFRDKIKNYYKSEYQAFVGWVDNNFYSDIARKSLMADYHAFIYLIDHLDGINYRHTISEYGQRSIEIIMKSVNVEEEEIQQKDRFHEGDYNIITRAFDWMWHELTNEQKEKIANWLADVGIKILTERSKGILNGNVRALFSSTYYESPHPWYLGLSIYGSGIRDEDAQILVDSFEHLCLNGKWVDAENWAARNQGGVSEVGLYGFWHLIKHIEQIDSWRTATGENYFSKSTNVADAYLVQYYPQYILYRIKPFGKINSDEPGGVEWNFIKIGQMDAGDRLGYGSVKKLLTSLG